MAHDKHSSPDHHGKHEQHGSLSQYLSVFVALLVLTAISFAVGNNATLKEKTPGVMWAAMMAVSCAKAMLVIMFFMHLKWEANWKYVLTIPASLMSLFLVLMLIPDIGRRTVAYSEERGRYAAEKPVHAGHDGHDHGAHDAAEHKPEHEAEMQSADGQRKAP